MVRRIALPTRLIMFMSFAGTSLVNYIFGLAAGWLLMPGDFGLLAFAQTILLICGLILNSGFSWSLALALTGVDRTRQAALVRGASIANLLLACATSGLIFLLFGLGPLRLGLESWSITGVIGLSLPFISLIATARGALQGMGQLKLLALLLISETVAKTLSGVCLILLGLGATGAIAGFLIGAAVASTLGIVLLMRLLHAGLVGAVARPNLKSSGEMFGALLGMALLLNLDIVALKLFSGADRSTVGYYQAAIILANTPYYLANAMIPVLFAKVARLQDIERTEGVISEAIQIILVLLLPVEAALILAPEFFLSLLFPQEYMAGAAVLRLLALGNSALMLVVIVSVSFQATENARISARILLATVTVELIALYAFVPQWHGIGAASIFAVATTSALIVLGVRYLRRLKTPNAHRIFGWLAKYLLAGAVGSAVLVVIQLMSFGILLALVLSAFAYVLSALALGLLHLPDLKMELRHSSVASLSEEL
jgi:O-antigen/teichoic acid export membrane protein